MKALTATEIKATHTGVMQSLFFEFEQHRLPRVLKLKAKVDRGEVVNDVDFDFLCQQVNDACTTKHLIVNYPELEEFCLQLGHLYKEICDKAVENENKSSRLS